MTTNKKDERLHHIDWIRVLAFMLLICFHSALPFTTFPWEVKNEDQSDQLSSIIWWFHQWRLPLLLIFLRLYLRFPESGGLIGDWFVLTFSITMLLLGFFLGGDPDFWSHCMRNLRWHGSLALLCTASLFIFYWWPLRLPEKSDVTFYVYAMLNVIAIWQTILFICGMARKYLNKESMLLTYLNSAVFPFFIIHQTIIVAIGYYVVNSSLNIPVKLTILITLSTLVIFVAFHFIIRKTRLTRILFGMKSAPVVK